MAELQCMPDLYEYCLRRLGKPVINIEIDEAQAEDRLQDAIDFFILRHFQGVEERHLGFAIDQTTLDRGYVNVAENIVAVSEVLRITGAGSGDEFDRLNFLLKDTDIFDQMSKGSMTNYYVSRMNIALMQEILNPEGGHTFNAITHRLYLNSSVGVGDRLFAHVYVSVDPDEFTNVYNNEWVKKYATALMKEQWGLNLKKFAGVQLPGGLELNGQVIYDEATAEIATLEEKFSLEYELPVDMFIG